MVLPMTVFKTAAISSYANPPKTVYQILELLSSSLYDSVMSIKKCTKCGEEKELSEFYRRIDRPSGRRSYCKYCYREAYYWTHREKLLAGHRSWERANPEKTREYEKKRRKRKLGTDGNHTTAQWHNLLKKCKNECLSCCLSGDKETLHRDHIVPLSRDGSDYITNIQPLCRSCNSSKGTKTIDYRPAKIKRFANSLLDNDSRTYEM